MTSPHQHQPGGPWCTTPECQPAIDPNANLRRAGVVAIWVWVVVALLPVAVVLFCCFGVPLLGAISGTPR